MPAGLAENILGHFFLIRTKNAKRVEQRKKELELKKYRQTEVITRWQGMRID